MIDNIYQLKKQKLVEICFTADEFMTPGGLLEKGAKQNNYLQLHGAVSGLVYEVQKILQAVN